MFVRPADAAQHRGLLVSDRAHDHQEVGLARREARQRHAEAVGVEARACKRHELHAAARGDERVLEERELARPGERVLVARGEERVALIVAAGTPVLVQELLSVRDSHRFLVSA